jgi:16S rRNA G966 N2-methylase RsmD
MREMISRHSSEGDLVLDPFCGSGTVGLEAIISGRNFVGFDLNPFSIFLTESTLTDRFDPLQIESDFERLISLVQDQILEIYKRDSEYVLYTIPGKKNKKTYNVVLCDRNFKKTRSIFDPNLGTEYGLLESMHLSIPDAAFPQEFYKDRFSYKGVRRVSDLFSRDNLLALDMIWKSIKLLGQDSQSFFRLVLSNTLLHVSKLKSESVRPLGVNNYWIPDDFIDENVLWRFMDRYKNFMEAKLQIRERFRDSLSGLGTYSLFNEDSISLSRVKNESIDYILTDPPYGDVIQYGELSFIWNTWLGVEHRFERELIINPVQKKDEDYFDRELSVFISAAFRVLKLDGHMTLCFQNKDPKIWLKVAQSSRNAGFTLTSIEAFSPLGNPFTKNWSENSPKLDLYVTLCKSREGMRNSPGKTVTVDELLSMTFLDRFPDGEVEVHDSYSRFVGHLVSQVLQGNEISDLNTKTFRRVKEALTGQKDDAHARYHQEELF